MKTTNALRTRKFTRALAGSIAALLAVQAAQAAVVYWDADGSATSNSSALGTNLGGTGNWNNSTSGTPLTNWWNGSSASDQAWVNAGNDTAVFWGTAGTVTLTDAVTVGGLIFNTTGYTIDAQTNAQTLTFGATNDAVTLNNIAAATITGTVGGAGNLAFSRGFGTTAGTVTFNGTSTGGWTGTTTVSTGLTVALAQSNQALLSTSGITLNGGGITLTNTDSTEGTLDRVGTAGITSNGGTFTYANTSGSGLTYTETVGAVALTTGQLNVVMSTDMVGGGGNVQTLTLGTGGPIGLPQTGTSAVTFSAAGTGLGTVAAPSTTNVIKVNVAGTTAAGGIIAPWATVGTAASAQTDYAVYVSDQVVGAGIAATGQVSWTDSTVTGNYTLSGADTLGGTRTINTLRYTGGANSLALGASNLQTFGILNGGSGLLTISGTGIVRQNGTAAATLYVTTGSTAANITISAPVQNNTGALSLVKNGAGTLTLSGSTSSNTFSGNIVINGGTIDFPNNGLGTAPAVRNNSWLTLNGGTFSATTGTNNNYNTNRGIFLGPGGGTLITNTWQGPISGSGNLYISSGQFRMNGGGSSGATGSFDNTYTGDTIPIGSTNINPYRALGFQFSTLDLSQSTGGNPLTNINGIASATFGGLKGTGNIQIPVFSAGLFIGNNNKDTLYSGTMSGSAWTKIGTGTLTLTGTNTYTGATTVSAGVLNIQNATATGTVAGGVTVASGAALELQHGTGMTVGNEALALSGTGIGNAGALRNIGGTNVWQGTVTLGSAARINSDAGTLTFNIGANSITGTQNLTLGGAGAGTVSGTITTGTGTLTKDGAGTWTLAGANTYSGTTTVSAGTLEVLGGSAIANAGAVNVASVAGAKLLVSASETIGSLSGGTGANGEVALVGNTLTVGDASTVTFGGTISGTAGTGTLLKQGTGVQNLDATAVLTFDNLTANDGTINVNSALGTGTGTAVVAVNDTAGGAATKLRFGTVSQTLSSLTIGAGATVVFTSGAATGAFSGGVEGKAAGFGSAASSFGPGASGSAVVPEPGTIGLLLVGALGVLNRRRRRV